MENNKTKVVIIKTNINTPSKCVLCSEEDYGSKDKLRGF